MYSVFYDFYFELWSLHSHRYCNVSNQGFTVTTSQITNADL